MATLGHQGSVIANCPGCDGAKATFQHKSNGHAYGNVMCGDIQLKSGRHGAAFGVLMRCGGCGWPALAVIASADHHNFVSYDTELIDFYRETTQQLALPTAVPKGIAAEFREAESCLGHGNFRAAAGLFRSVLDKTLRASGYKLKRGTPLEQQIDAASADGIITESRRRRAHDEVRVLGNDVLHDEWRELQREDVEAAHHYSQRILEDFYDDRPSTLTVLRSKGKVPQEDEPAQQET